jgi:hypothetical protein
MIWWFLILGMSTVIVAGVAAALYMRLRRHLQAAQAAQEENSPSADLPTGSGKIEP